MILKGIHHITAITGDSPLSVDFYVRVMGLRMVKKTVNFDAPDIYHLYFADEIGSPGSILTFFEYPGAPRGRHGTGMIHTIMWGVRSGASLDFWENRLAAEGVSTRRSEGSLKLADPEGLGIEFTVDPPDRPVLAAEWAQVPAEHSLRGFSGVRVYGTPEKSSDNPGTTDSDKVLNEVLGFERTPDGYRLEGGVRPATYTYDQGSGPGYQGAGSVHHIAWACEPEDQERWRVEIQGGGLRPTPIIDRQYFHSIYFREPSGVLFEIATIGPGFTIDEPLEALGEELRLPPRYEHLRDDLQPRLTPLINPRRPPT